jgi:IS30 family transposase
MPATSSYAANDDFNGLLRQFFPKGTVFRSISPIEVKHVHELLSDRPRKRLRISNTQSSFFRLPQICTLQLR